MGVTLSYLHRAVPPEIHLHGANVGLKSKDLLQPLGLGILGNCTTCAATQGTKTEISHYWYPSGIIIALCNQYYVSELACWWLAVKEERFFLKDLNDQTKSKKENTKRIEERLVSASLLSWFFRKVSQEKNIINSVELGCIKSWEH